MKGKSVFTLLATIAVLVTAKAQTVGDYLVGEYDVYRVQINDEDTFYFNTSTLLNFLPHFGQPSGNIFDFDSSGLTDANDLLAALTGWGNTFQPDYVLEDALIFNQFSSGWFLFLPEWEAIFLQVTPVDEEEGQQCQCTYIPDTLNSFFLQGERNGETWRVWYHKQ